MCRVKEERNILHTIKIKKIEQIGHILRSTYPLCHVIGGKIQGRVEYEGEVNSCLTFRKREERGRVSGNLVLEDAMYQSLDSSHDDYKLHLYSLK